MAKEINGVSTVNRVCSILTVFDEDKKSLTLTEISRAVGLPKSTTFRLLSALEEKGILMRDVDGRSFRLGYMLIHLGILAQDSISLRNLALPVLRRLSDETRETSVLSMLDRNHNVGIWIEQIESPQAVRWARRVGHPLNLHAGASSKVLWAFLPESEAESILDKIELIPLMPNTITEKERMRTELREIRRQGYAVSFEETDNGAMGVAAPVYDHNNQPVAGIGIIGPVSRVSPEQIPEITGYVLHASRVLSTLLGATSIPDSHNKEVVLRQHS